MYGVWTGLDNHLRIFYFLVTSDLSLIFTVFASSIPVVCRLVKATLHCTDGETQLGNPIRPPISVSGVKE